MSQTQDFGTKYRQMVQDYARNLCTEVDLGEYSAAVNELGREQSEKIAGLEGKLDKVVAQRPEWGLKPEDYKNLAEYKLPVLIISDDAHKKVKLPSNQAFAVCRAEINFIGVPERCTDIENQVMHETQHIVYRKLENSGLVARKEDNKLEQGHFSMFKDEILSHLLERVDGYMLNGYTMTTFNKKCVESSHDQEIRYINEVLGTLFIAAQSKGFNHDDFIEPVLKAKDYRQVYDAFAEAAKGGKAIIDFERPDETGKPESYPNIDSVIEINFAPENNEFTPVFVYN